MAVRRQLIAGNGISSIVSSQDQPVRRRQFDRILRFGIVGVAVIRDTPRATEFIGCGENASERGNWLGKMARKSDRSPLDRCLRLDPALGS